MLAMKTATRAIFVFFVSLLILNKSFAQTLTISGKISNSESKDAVPAASVLLKGSTSGTYTDGQGNFKLTINHAVPFTLIISSIGYETKEFEVVSASTTIAIELKPASVMGTEVVISATRSQIRSLESPVSIERMGSAAIREVAGPSFYDAIGNLKGVDVVTSSMLFKTMGTRGFNGSGNLRMNQLVDGMDNQAPGLNFSVGNIAGLNELDVDNVELLPGASSALYGSGGMTGTILMTSKDPYKYQGLSAEFKQGVNHISDPSMSAAPYYDIMARYAQSFNKFAFRISADYIQGKDWTATNYSNYSPLQGSPIAGNRSLPNYNGVNTYGDENEFFTVSNGLASAAQQYLAMGDPVTAGKLMFIDSLTPKNSGVTRTGYAENTLTNYKAYNFKASGGLYYKISDNTTVSLTGNYGATNTVYTGTDRYNLQNVTIGQYKAEVSGKNFYVRAYTTQENAGNSYDMVVTGDYLNEAYAPTATVWAPTYIGAYAQSFGAALLAGLTPAQAYDTASIYARTIADQNRYKPGTAAFNNALNTIKQTPIPNGGKFEDQTDLYVGEGMYNFADMFKWADITVGASTKEYILNSHGTIFADTAGTIKINESGAFAQVQKGFLQDKLKVTVAGRYDKSTNFTGRFTPRITAVFQVAKDNYIRASFQTAYRFPSNQNQYIDLQTGEARLIGGLPQFITYYHLNDTSTGGTYDTATLAAYKPGDPLPQQYQFKEFKPETVSSWEIGYKGIIGEKLFIDIYGFYAQYTNFIGLTVLVKNPFVLGVHPTNTYAIYTNSTNKVNTVGAGLGLQYTLPKGFFIGGNVAYNDLSNVDADVLTQFNTPKVKYNISLGNYTIKKVFGFNLTYRWQENYYYSSSFVSGNTAAFGVLDAQISMKLPKMNNSMIKIGASNILNHYYTDAVGNPQVGGLYYVSLGYNVF
jgi:outer membrane receptor protein involved in Fe transport